MNFHVHKHIVVEDNTPQMDEEDTGDFTEQVSFRGLSSVSTVVAKIVRDYFSLMGSFQSCPQFEFPFDLHTKGKESLFVLFLEPAGVADHLSHVSSLEYLI